MSSSKKYCPIPLYQRPANEYKILRSSCFFSWPASSFTSFLLQLLSFWLIMSCLGLVVFNNLLAPMRFEKAILLDVFWPTLLVVMFLIRLYLGWSYVMQRLLSATVFYEESGWYDGQIWIKPSEVLTEDRLLGIYEVKPLVKTIRQALLFITATLLIEIIIYFYV